MPPNCFSNHMLSEFANCIHTARQNSIPGTFYELAELIAFQAVEPELCSFNLYSPATGMAKTNIEDSMPSVAKLCPGGPCQVEFHSSQLHQTCLEVSGLCGETGFSSLS